MTCLPASVPSGFILCSSSEQFSVCRPALKLYLSSPFVSVSLHFRSFSCLHTALTWQYDPCTGSSSTWGVLQSTRLTGWISRWQRRSWSPFPKYQTWHLKQQLKQWYSSVKQLLYIYWEPQCWRQKTIVPCVQLQNHLFQGLQSPNGSSVTAVQGGFTHSACRWTLSCFRRQRLQNGSALSVENKYSHLFCKMYIRLNNVM